MNGEIDMRIKDSRMIYDNFDTFLNKFIINKNSILTDHTGILTDENINKCIELFVDNANEGKGNFEYKVKEQFKDASESVKLVFAHANWLWAMAADDITKEGKKRAVKICLDDNFILNEKYFNYGFGSAGTYHKQNKYWEIAFNLRLFKAIQKNQPKDIEECKRLIERICLYEQYIDKSYDDADYKDIRELLDKDDDKLCAMFNILLHLSNPDKYETIIANTHKEQLVASFESLLGEDDKEKNTDEKISIIRAAIEASDESKKDFSFYEREFLKIWNPVMSDKTYSEYQALKYKKSIILYGPPGTSKTYSANEIAKSFILQEFIAKNKENVKSYFEGKVNVDSCIHHFQLHSNYSYEDFIIGMQLKDGQTVPTKGEFLKLCEAVEKDDMPHVAILDEINRIDISRLFGELFSGIENRDKEIKLPIGEFKIKVPQNLYIIGTMNEIDFSLEQIDFALRRRFVWFFYGFNENILDNILKNEIDKKGKLNIVPSDIDKFKENAKLLNEEIRNMEELGKEYEIGHTFFSEIVDIAYGFKGKQGYINNISLFKSNGPAEVLWNISIKPIIEAFLGNMEKDTVAQKLTLFKGIFLNGGK